MSEATLIEIVARALLANQIGEIQAVVKAKYGKDVWIAISEDCIIIGAANSSGSTSCEVNMGYVKSMEPLFLVIRIMQRLAECANFIRGAGTDE